MIKTVATLSGLINWILFILMQKNKNKNKNNVGFIKYITYCINLLISNIVNKKKKKLIIYAPPSTVSYLVAHYDVPELGGLGYFTQYPSPPSSGTKQDK